MPLFLIGILFFLVTACLPINKKISVPINSDKPPIPIKKPSVRSSTSLPSEKSSGKKHKSLCDSLKLESDIGYQKRTESLGSSPAEEDLFDVKEGNGQTMVGPQLSSEYIGERLAHYEMGLGVWNELVGSGVELGAGDPPETWRKCIMGMRRMAAGYRRLWELSKSGSDQGQSVGAAWGLLQRDIHFLESGCDVFRKEALANVGEISGEMMQNSVGRMKSLVDHYMIRGDYPGAISAYENVTSLLSADDIDFSLMQQYVSALVYSGRLEEAKNVLRGILSRQGVYRGMGAGDLVGPQWSVVGKYADLLFASGEGDQAKKLYLRLDDAIAAMEKDNDWVAGQLHFLADYRGKPLIYADYVELLRTFVISDDRGVSIELQESYANFTNKYREFALLSGARRIMRRAEEKTRVWARRKLDEAKDLAVEKDFSGAKMMLGQLVDIPEDMAAEVEALTVDIVARQQEDADNYKIIEKEELAGQWQKANTLLEQKEYEQAIVAFALLVHSEHRLEAKIGMNKAIEGLAVSQRRQAANLFFQAQKTKGVQEKKELFRQSRLLLIQILRRYPNIDLAEKMRQNLTVLDAQIRGFDPKFLKSLKDSQKK